MHKIRAAAFIGVTSLILSAGSAFADDSHVDTKDGVVMLTGMVGSTAEKELAEKDTKTIEGVVAVHNELKVQP